MTSRLSRRRAVGIANARNHPFEPLGIDDPPAPLFALLGLVLAVGYHPLHVVLEGLIDELLFGQRPDPLVAASQRYDVRVLRDDYGVEADVWSATSFTELKRDGETVERRNRLNPDAEPERSWVETCLADRPGPAVAAIR